jgi:hypothetical protein
MGPNLRAKLINRAFRKMWDISDEFIRGVSFHCVSQSPR